MDEVICYKVGDRFFEDKEKAVIAQTEDDIRQLFQGTTIHQTIEKLARDKEFADRLIDILEGVW